ncbi:MAG: integrase [Chromatiales bacterium 21-64-14]|nr:MAG: integrase [Chromatiales bacterium 21-64-14]
MHGLRHVYDQNRDAELTGWSCPAAVGPVARELTLEQRELDRKARLTSSRELGHEREAVVATYLGR